MTSKELKEAFLQGCPVIYDEVEYKGISEIVYWKKDGKIYESAVLETVSGRAEIRVLGCKIEKKGNC